MLAGRFGGGREGEQLVLGATADGLDAGQGGLAPGEGAGLVEQHGVHGAHLLEREAVLDQHPAAGGALGRDRDHQRDRETQGMGAGDDQHGDRPDHGLVGAADEEPDDRGEEGGAEREPEQPAGGGVRDPLGAGGGALRLGDELPDPGERGVLADGGDLEAQAGVRGDGAGDHLIPDLLCALSRIRR